MKMHFFKSTIIACSVVASVSLPAIALDDSGVPRVRSRQFDVTYSVNANAAPLTKVELWQRVEGSDDWSRFGIDEDLASPVAYVADAEGLHELFFVITNSAGTSGPSPTADTAPHFSVFVDFTEPIIQLQLVRSYENAKGQTLARLEWSAMDLHLDARPIGIAYRTVGETDWKIAKAQLPNTGLYEWSVPDGVSGKLEFRITVTDQGGNSSSVISDGVKIGSTPQPSARALPPVDERNGMPADAIEVSGANLSASEQHRLNQLIKRGKSLRENHDDTAAERLFRQALAIEPKHPEALVNLGQSLFALGRYEESATAFHSALTNSPKHPGALLGLAETLINEQQFDAAESKLLDLVASGRHDATTWLRLGDVAAYKGQSFAAHDFYSKVLSSPSPEKSSFDPIALAKARLAELAIENESKPETVNREVNRN